MGEKKRQALFDKARNSPYGWQRGDLDDLYTSYGFVIEKGTKHDIAKHPNHLDLRGTLTRSSHNLHPDYVRHAVDMIRKLQEREKE